MNKNNLLLVYESKGYGISDRLVNIGYRVIVSDDREKALSKLRRLEFKAVLVVVERDEFDALEFVLSVLQADESTPVIIVNLPEEEELDIEVFDRNNIYLVDEGNGDLKAEIRDILEDKIH